MKHDATGATYVHIDRQALRAFMIFSAAAHKIPSLRIGRKDSENAFCVAFRTPPTDSTGALPTALLAMPAISSFAHEQLSAARSAAAVLRVCFLLLLVAALTRHCC